MGRVIGYDLTDISAQVSVSKETDKGEEVHSIPVFAGSEKYVIPVAAYRSENGDMHYGEDALQHVKDRSELITGILSGACENKEGYSEILEGFLRATLRMASLITPLSEIERVVITLPKPEEKMVKTVLNAVGFLEKEHINVRVVGYPECFFYYAMNQDDFLTRNKIALFDYDGNSVHSMLLSTRTDTRPHLSMVEERTFDMADRDDMSFLEIARSVLDSEIVSAVYLSGEGFEGGWLKESVAYLCERRRRVFQGRNLYTKGACYVGIDDREGNPLLESCRFFDDDKLVSDIGVYMITDGQEIYWPILTAGVNWYEANGETEFMLGEDQEIRIRVENYFTKDVRYSVIRGDSFPKRPDRCTRMRLKVYMVDVSTVHCEATDLGFGEIFKSSGEVVSAKIYI
ncbi:MAG: hypothetical protein K6G03_03825 [Lachnospiraceae bacterium]|nr:hypothetical protein [Lachnospiraceae bacterium]